MCRHKMADDEAVKATSDDAASCKRYASQKGYWKDDFIRFFSLSVDRKAPEISRGYYARVTAIYNLVREFIQFGRVCGKEVQVISLGAGSDTTFWRLEGEGLLPAQYVEVDFDDVVRRKCHIIKSHPELCKALPQTADSSIGDNEIHSLNYHLISGDLRQMEVTGSKILSSGVDLSLPTFILAECVLVYLKPEFSAALVDWMGKTFDTALFVNYDPMLLNDGFGRVMQRNVKARGCDFFGLDAYPDIPSHESRFLQHNWTACCAVDMATVYHSLPAQDRQRIERLEFFDEGELLEQLLQHYCLSCGTNDALDLGLKSLFKFGR